MKKVKRKVGIRRKKMMDRWKKGMVFVVICLILFACSRVKLQESIPETISEKIPIKETEVTEAKEDTSGYKESGEEKNQQPEPTVLEQFGAYLKELIEESRIDELESYVISRPLTWEEGGEMADWCPAFEHFSKYGRYRFGSEGVILVAADVNGDGVEDLIEYLPCVYTGGLKNQYSLVIYLGDGEKNYHVTYYQPNFETRIRYFEPLLVINYQNSIFLLLEQDEPIIIKNQQKKMAAYQIEEGTLTSKFYIEYEYSDIDAEILYDTEEMKEKAEKLVQHAEEYYFYDDDDYEESGVLFQESAEKQVEEDSEEYDLLSKLGEEEKEEYEKKYEKTMPLSFGSAALTRGARVMYHSDIDNDGEEEIYAKAHDLLGIFTDRSFYLYRTGELYQEGKYEGKWGLNYLLANNGERTDLKTLCGLDIWSKGYIPQMFFVGKVGKENITFIQYYDNHYLIALIEGYRIRERSYETVLSVKYRPKIRFQIAYERRTKEEQEAIPTYFIYLEEKEEIVSPKMIGLSDQELEKTINENVETILQENMEEFTKGRIYGGVEGACYNVIYATKEMVLIDYVAVGLNGVGHGTGVEIFVEINLKNGAIQLYKDLEMTQEEVEECVGW